MENGGGEGGEGTTIYNAWRIEMEGQNNGPKNDAGFAISD